MPRKPDSADRTKKVQLSFQCGRDDYDAFMVLAARTRVPKQVYLREALSLLLKKYGRTGSVSLPDEGLTGRPTRPYGRLRFRGLARSLDGRFRAMIQVNGRKFTSGRFDTDVEAAREYDRLARLHRGKFAKTNFK